MNWFARNIAVALIGGATSILTAALMIYLEAGGGDPMFGFTILHIVPLGAICAGLIGATGYLLSAAALRLRPTFWLLTAMLAISAGVVFLVQSAEFGLFMGGPDYCWKTTRSFKSFSHFLGRSIWHSPLRFWSTGDATDDEAMAAFFSPGTSPAAPRVGMTGDSAVDGIGAGVSGMMATQDVSRTQTGQHLDQMGQGIQLLGKRVHTHGGQWILLLMQVAGFTVGGLVVFGQLRSPPYCKSCMLLLNRKGEQARYFSRSREMRLAVDEVLFRARDKQLQQSVHAHTAKGSVKGGNWTEFCSTLEIRRCMMCRVHRMDYRVARKDGERWKAIEVFGFSATTLEPLNFAEGGAVPRSVRLEARARG